MAELVPDYYNVPEITLSYKLNFCASERPSVNCMEDAHDIFRQVQDENKMDLLEEGKVMFLNRSNHVIGICNLSSGGITGTVMDTRYVFAVALKANACNIILVHNHTSDNLRPSYPNRTLTEKMKTAGELLDIKVVDHLIIGRSGCYSMSADDRLFIPQAKVIVLPRPDQKIILRQQLSFIEFKKAIRHQITSNSVCKSYANEKGFQTLIV